MPTDLPRSFSRSPTKRDDYEIYWVVKNRTTGAYLQGFYSAEAAPHVKGRPIWNASHQLWDAQKFTYFDLALESMREFANYDIEYVQITATFRAGHARTPLWPTYMIVGWVVLVVMFIGLLADYHSRGLI